MSMMRLMFAGDIKRSELVTLGGKEALRLSIVKGNPAKPGEEKHFTWANITVWEPNHWAKTNLVTGAYIAGSGDMILRGYDQAGVRKYALDVRCSGYDITTSNRLEDVPGTKRTPAEQETVRIPTRNNVPETSDEPPF
jgi:hypothetical protein